MKNARKKIPGLSKRSRVSKESAKKHLSRKKKSKTYLEMRGVFEELAALRKVAIAARRAVEECKGTGRRFPSLIKTLENLDDNYWHQQHGDKKNPTR